MGKTNKKNKKPKNLNNLLSVYDKLTDTEKKNFNNLYSLEKFASLDKFIIKFSKKINRFKNFLIEKNIKFDVLLHLNHNDFTRLFRFENKLFFLIKNKLQSQKLEDLLIVLYSSSKEKHKFLCDFNKNLNSLCNVLFEKMGLCSDEEKNTIVKRFLLLDWQILNTLLSLNELPNYLKSLNVIELKNFIDNIYFFSLKSIKNKHGDILEYDEKILMQNILSFMQKLKSNDDLSTSLDLSSSEQIMNSQCSSLKN